MKKKFLAVTCMALASMFALGSCNMGGGGDTSAPDSTGNGGGSKATIAEAKNLEGFTN